MAQFQAKLAYSKIVLQSYSGFEPRLQKLQRNSWGVTYHNRVHAKYRGTWVPLCNRSCKNGCKNRWHFATFATRFVSAHVTAAGILSTASLYIMIKY